MAFDDAGRGVTITAVGRGSAMCVVLVTDLLPLPTDSVTITPVSVSILGLLEWVVEGTPGVPLSTRELLDKSSMSMGSVGMSGG